MKNWKLPLYFCFLTSESVSGIVRMTDRVFRNSWCVGACLLVDALPSDDDSCERFHISTRCIVEWRARISRVGRGDACNLFPWIRHWVGRLSRNCIFLFYFFNSKFKVFGSLLYIPNMWCHYRSPHPMDKDSEFCFQANCSCVSRVPGQIRPRSNPVMDLLFVLFIFFLLLF